MFRFVLGLCVQQWVDPVDKPRWQVWPVLGAFCGQQAEMLHAVLFRQPCSCSDVISINFHKLFSGTCSTTSCAKGAEDNVVVPEELWPCTQRRLCARCWQSTPRTQYVSVVERMSACQHVSILTYKHTRKWWKRTTQPTIREKKLCCGRHGVGATAHKSPRAHPCRLRCVVCIFLF